MPKKKSPPTAEPVSEPVDNKAPDPSLEAASEKNDTPALQEPHPEIEETAQPENTENLQKKPVNRWVLISGAAVAGIMVGFLISYLLLIKPIQDQLMLTTDMQSSGVISANQIKSDLSNTRLRQQEMEIRYLTAAARLESANQYILLLRMKEQTAKAHLFVSEKNGLEARKALAELKTLFDHLSPYIAQKDAASAVELDKLIQGTIQDLTNDPESASSDLVNISENLDKVEAALFQME